MAEYFRVIGNAKMMFGINRQRQTEDESPEIERGSRHGEGTSDGDLAKANIGPIFSLILLISALVSIPGAVAAQSPSGARFVIAEDSGDRTWVEWHHGGQPIVRLSINSGYLDKFRGSLSRATQTGSIVLFAERDSLTPLFREPVARDGKAHRLGLRITLYADNSVDLHWSVWDRYSPSTILGSGVVARRYNQNLLRLSIEQIRYKDLVYIPARGRGLVHKEELLWDDFEVFIFDVRGRTSAFKDAYFECVGAPTVRVDPMHRCQFRAQYRGLTVRADILRHSLEDTEPFEARLRQVLDALFAP